MMRRVQSEKRGGASVGAGRTRRLGLFRAARLAVALMLAPAMAVQPGTAAPAGSIGDLVAATSQTAPAPASPRASPRLRGSEETVRLSTWSIGGDGDRTVMVFDLSIPAPIRVFSLAAPNRVVVDLPSSRFERGPERAHGGRGLIASWRFGESAAGRSRLVLEMRRAVKIERAEIDAAAPVGVSRLVVELVPGTDADMTRGRAIDIAAPLGLEASAAAMEPAHDGATPATKGDRRPTAAPIASSASPVVRPVVVIDAGHGGIDAGTVSPATGTPEKTVVLDMARVLARHLRDSGRYDVVMTREQDAFLGLGERVKIARAHHADLFLSVHADAEYDHSVRGATIYTLAEKASDEQAAALAAKENQSDALAGHVVEDAGAEVADILADLTLRETRRLSHVFARDLLAEYRRSGRLVKTQPHRQAGLRVLRAHDVPSALVELGFLSNKEDEALMTSNEWRERTAGSLVAAIDRYFAARGSMLGATRDVGDGAPASP